MLFIKLIYIVRLARPDLTTTFTLIFFAYNCLLATVANSPSSDQDFAVGATPRLLVLLYMPSHLGRVAIG